MGILNMSPRRTFFIAIVLAIVLIFAVFAFASRPAEAPLDNQSFTENASQESTLETPETVQGVSETQQTHTQVDESCDKNSTENSYETGSGITNESSTTVNCEVNQDSNSTSVNVTNNVDQTAESGSSTGSTGSVNNSSQSTINIRAR